MDVAEGDLIRQGLAVLLVFLLLGTAVWKLRGGGPLLRGNANGARMASLGRLALTPQHAVHLLRIDGRDLILATHPQGCSVLSDLTHGEPKKVSA